MTQTKQTNTVSQNTIQRLRENASRHRDELMQWLRIPSVSSDSRRVDQTHRAGDWLMTKFEKAGLACRKIETDGFPLVYAETAAVPGAPIALVYGHYDVQPPEPLDLWSSPPFEPEIRDGKVFARGATDDKGQVLTHVHAVCDAIAAGESLPIQVKFLIEGEEEIGSANLEAWLPRIADTIRCDVVVVSDSSQYAPGCPAITCGLRGIATYELRVDGPSHDLHSGSFGGAIANPAIGLCHLLSSLVDRDGRIAIDGFYDDVQPIPEVERASWYSLASDDAAFADSCGASTVFGESGYTSDERRWARPSLDINGLTSGHQGEGVKTVLPATASAKFSFRLVLNQDPARVTELLRAHLASHCPTGLRIELQPDHGAGAMVADANSPFTEAASNAINEAFGVPPVLIREGGSIPILATFQHVLQCDVLLLGWGQNDDAAHSPNEKLSLDDFHRGIHASTSLWQAMGSIEQRSAAIEASNH
ncbi:MAG: dipeptidase [Planctomycetota bacterium]